MLSFLDRERMDRASRHGSCAPPSLAYTWSNFDYREEVGSAEGGTQLEWFAESRRCSCQAIHIFQPRIFPQHATKLEDVDGLTGTPTTLSEPLKLSPPFGTNNFFAVIKVAPGV